VIDLSSLRLSVEIALTTCAVFLAGRLIAWLAPRSARAIQIVRGVVIAVSIMVALYFYFSPSSRYALLLPAAFALGCLTLDRRQTVQLFERDSGGNG
jgi:Na+/melibiose symporter-like transporter